MNHPKTLIDRSILNVLPQRSDDSHKGTFGHVLIVGGAPGMIGAPMLAARAALKTGAGKISIGFVAEHFPAVDMLYPELMLDAVQNKDFSGINAIGIGPGLGCSVVAKETLSKVLTLPVPIVLDADALNCLAQSDTFKKMCVQRSALGYVTIMTPHPLEAARLMNQTVSVVQANRSHAAQMMAQTWQAICVLKGFGTLVAMPADKGGAMYLNSSGNPALASAGTGDVLTGLLAGLLAQGLNAKDAACLAVWIHGRTADQWLAQQPAGRGFSASVLIEQIQFQ